MSRAMVATPLRNPWRLMTASRNPSSIEPESPMKMLAG